MVSIIHGSMRFEVLIFWMNLLLHLEGRKVENLTFYFLQTVGNSCIYKCFVPKCEGCSNEIHLWHC